ncbi:MAG TPA: hypothetical protein VGC92_09400 [Phenylobacterium sp.]|jgi:hypothetical protein
MTHRLAMLGMLAVLAYGAPAVASQSLALPAASSSADCNHANSPYVSGSLSCTDAGARATISPGNPFVFMEAHAGNGDGSPENAFATLSYSFEVTGGSAGDIVPVGLAVSLFTSGAYPNYAFAEVYTDGSGAFATGAMVCTDGSCPQGAAFDGTLHFSSASGQVRRLTIYIGAEEGFATTGDAYARADPQFFINLPTGNPYDILLSPGVSNGAPGSGGAPEPGVWALMLVGFASVGVMVRARARSRVVFD